MQEHYLEPFTLSFAADNKTHLNWQEIKMGNLTQPKQSKKLEKKEKTETKLYNLKFQYFSKFTQDVE